MKFTVDYAPLVAAVSKVRGVINLHHQDPVCLNLKLDVDKDNGIISLSATDNKQSLVVRMPATVLEDGEILLPGSAFEDSIRALDKTTPITISDVKTGIKITSGATKFNLRGQATTGFPDLNIDKSSAQAYEMRGSVLHKMLSLVTFAIASEKTRFTLDGVYFQANVDLSGLAVVGSDSKQLALAEYKTDLGNANKSQAIVPKHGVDLIQWVSQNTEGAVRLYITATQLIVESDMVVATTQLLNGLYPNYRAIMPKVDEFDIKAELNLKDLLGHIKRASQFITPDTPSLELKFNPDKLVLTSFNPDKGDAETELPATLNEDSFKTKLNGYMIVNGWAHISGDIITLNMKDEDSIVLCEEIVDDIHYAYLAMPSA